MKWFEEMRWFQQNGRRRDDDDEIVGVNEEGRWGEWKRWCGCEVDRDPWGRCVVSCCYCWCRWSLQNLQQDRTLALVAPALLRMLIISSTTRNLKSSSSLATLSSCNLLRSRPTAVCIFCDSSHFKFVTCALKIGHFWNRGSSFVRLT